MIDIEQYHSFLEQKKIVFRSSGLEVNRNEINSILFEFQKDLVYWSLRKGRAAIFADTGLGKTGMQLEWARLVNQKTGLPVLIVAPLSVAKQTIREGIKLLGLEVVFSRSGNDIHPITITNYEMLKEFNPEDFGGIVLDESSILKSLDGKTKAFLIEAFTIILYRLCCSATPSPNDIVEIGGHSEFLGVLSETYMKANFFIHESEVGNNQWRLRKHSYNGFYRWLASWGMSLRKPSDLGYSDEGYNLPPLSIKPIFVESSDNQAFFHRLSGIGHRSKVRRETLDDKLEILKELVNNSDKQWIVWCGLNKEADLAKKHLTDNVEVRGSDSVDKKIKAIEDFQDGKVKVLITKPKIGGMGLNLQNSHNMVFFGLADSWETYYQCIRRQYRFGQNHPVNVYIILSELEKDIYSNIMRKEEQAKNMSEELIKNVQQYELNELESSSGREKFEYATNDVKGKINGLGSYHLMLGDSVERMKEIPNEEVDFSVYSPPFQDLYVYSPTERDIGNSGEKEDFLNHYGYVIDELYRTTKPGRVTAVHVADIQATLVKDGRIALKDFSGDVIREYEKRGWNYQARITIWKDPQVAAIRTRAKGLAFVQIERDQSWMRPAMPDYILLFRKPGDNSVKIERGLTNEEWIEWASPIWTVEDRADSYGGFNPWFDISATDTLQGYQNARGENDERHICPLQLPVIERCIKLWSNPGELVFTPFLGIGSEAYVAVKLGRNALGIELNPRYFGEAVKNMKKLSIVEERLF